MKYEIRITKIDTKKVTKRGEHTIIEERPWTKKEMSDESGYHQTAEEILATTPLKQVYGYAPPYEGTEKTEKEVFKQVVEDLDLQLVIKAVNGI